MEEGFTLLKAGASSVTSTLPQAPLITKMMFTARNGGRDPQGSKGMGVTKRKVSRSCTFQLGQLS
eukprot:1160428-Pelagomonas_calceolata.AAC.13